MPGAIVALVWVIVVSSSGLSGLAGVGMPRLAWDERAVHGVSRDAAAAAMAGADAVHRLAGA